MRENRTVSDYSGSDVLRRCAVASSGRRRGRAETPEPGDLAVLLRVGGERREKVADGTAGHEGGLRAHGKLQAGGYVVLRVHVKHGQPDEPDPAADQLRLSR
jgi:hypothetical protein